MSYPFIVVSHYQRVYPIHIPILDGLPIKKGHFQWFNRWFKPIDGLPIDGNITMENHHFQWVNPL